MNQVTTWTGWIEAVLSDGPLSSFVTKLAASLLATISVVWVGVTSNPA